MCAQGLMDLSRRRGYTKTQPFEGKFEPKRLGGGFKVKIPLRGRGMILWWKTMGKRFEQRRVRLQ